jgi:hypothetical protein
LVLQSLPRKRPSATVRAPKSGYLLDVQATLERARKVRELTVDYTVTADEIEKWINEGRE